MSEQINLFDEIEAADRDLRHKEAVKRDYRIWLKTPQLTPCDPHKTYFNYNIYSQIQHICDEKPADMYMWLNVVEHNNGGQYWLLNHIDDPAGELIEKCPYCGADLCHYEGQRYLQKTEGHWYWQGSYRKYFGLDEVEQ